MEHKVFAIDFDGTISTEEFFPKTGHPIPLAKEVINEIRELGGTVIIWTCRSGDAEHAAKQYLFDNKIGYDHINENCSVMKERYENDPRKIGADIYIDDKSIFEPINWSKIARHIFSVEEYINFLRKLENNNVNN